jgi:hypothetical protein
MKHDYRFRDFKRPRMKTLNCLRCGRPMEVVIQVPKIYCTKCRKEVRAEYDRKKGRRYYLAHRNAVIKKTTDYRRTILTPAQKRRYAARAMRHYHAQQAALNRSKAHNASVRRLKLAGDAISIVSKRQLLEPRFIVRGAKGAFREGHSKLEKLADEILAKAEGRA